MVGWVCKEKGDVILSGTVGIATQRIIQSDRVKPWRKMYNYKSTKKKIIDVRKSRVQQVQKRQNSTCFTDSKDITCSIKFNLFAFRSYRKRF